ncbi:VIR protein [Plasmodium vivax]|uniref:VIR protein n=1 Tax=Plasmodium vivax TaxID=5855 RepID=A0A1G4H790_PLAVI|nr:VIR protein [Plasmodium vivax]
MSEDVVDYIKLIDNDPTLCNNDLFKFYDKFSSKCEDSNGEDYCKVNMFEDVNGSANYIFKKLMRNVDRLKKDNGKHYDTIDNGNYTSKRCIYLKYWLYDKILTENINESSISKIFDALVQNKEKPTNNTTECEFYKIKLDEIKEIKKLYDYFVFYDGYKFVENIINDKIFNSVHRDYLKGAIDVHKQAKQKCPKNHINGYCNEYNKYIKDINSEVFNSLEKKLKDEDIVTLIEKTLKTKGTPSAQHVQGSQEKGDSSHNDFKQNVFLMESPLKKFFKSLNDKYTDTNTNKNTLMCNLLTKNKTPNSANMNKYCNIIKVILGKWDEILKSFESDFNKDQCCEHLNYWLHTKIQDNKYRSKDINLLYLAWDSIKQSNEENKHCQHKNFNVSAEDFKKKLKLYIFLEYYDSINKELSTEQISENDMYCNYIKTSFDLYYNMKFEDSNTGYKKFKDELDAFEKKINNTKLCDLKNKCPHRCLDLVYNKNNKALCSSEQEKSKVQTQESSKNFEATNKFNKSLLDKFPALKTYEEFNSNKDCYKYCHHCKSIYDYEKSYPGISDFCRMLVRNLHEIKYKNDSKDRCGYLYYWIYENAWRVFGENWNKIHGNEPIDRLFNIGYTIINELQINECFYEYDTKISFKEWKEKKDLHDYFENYDSIENIIKSFKKEKKDKYCEHFTYIKEIYKKYIRKCCKYYDHYNYENTCSDYFKCDRIYYPNKFLCKLECSSKESVDSLSKLDKNRVSEEQTGSGLLNSEMNTNSLGSASLTETQESIINELMKDPFYIFSLSGFTLLGTFMFFFIFYKFTPIGSRLNRSSRRQKEKKYNVNKEQRKEIVYSNSENQNVNVPKRRVRIAYQSS